IAALMSAIAHRPESIAVLLGNCPLRTAADIRDAHECFAASAADCVMSVVSFGWRPAQWALRVEEGRLVPVHFEKPPKPTDRPARWVCPSGAIRWTRGASAHRQSGYYDG